jgi:hypothetical protein
MKSVLLLFALVLGLIYYDIYFGTFEALSLSYYVGVITGGVCVKLLDYLFVGEEK